SARRQKGGAIVPGTGEGDTFHTALPLGSFVLNKKATAAFGFQRGGNVPVMLEPGERVFTPNEVQRVGPRRLQEMNAAVPRFQSGGEVGGTARMVLPQIVGPDPLRSLGQKAVEKVFNAAVKMLRREGGSHSYAAVLAEANRIDALRLPYVWGGGHQSTPAPANGPFDCSGAVSRLLQGAGFDIPTQVSGALQSFGEPGKGRVSVLANPEHVYAVVGDRAWGTSGENPGGGAGWIDGYTYRPGFTVRHADVMDLEVIRRSGEGQSLKPGYQQGGLIGLQEGGSFKGDINRIYREHNSGDGDWSGKALPSYVVAALAQKAGEHLGIPVPGRTMEQVTRGESGSHAPNSARPGATGIDPGGTKGIGLWMITTGYNDALIAKYGGQAAMRNPVRNSAAMAEIYRSNGLGAWYGTGSVAGTNIDYEGKYDIRDALGGKSYAKALGSGGAGAAASAAQETVPPTFHGASTSPLAFGSPPKTVKAVDKELERRQKDVRQYRKAAKLARKKKKPLTAEAIDKNVEALQGRIKELWATRRDLRRKEARKEFTEGLKGGVGKIAGFEPAIEERQLDFEAKNQYAEQVVALEPQPPQLSDGASPKEQEDAEKAYAAAFKSYVDNNEQGAYGQLLDSAAAWRNEILKAQRKAAGPWDSSHKLGGIEGHWEDKILGIESKIEHIDHLKDVRKKHKEEYWKKHPERLKHIREQIARLPQLLFEQKELQKSLGEARAYFYPGKARVPKPTPPREGSGSLEEALKELQGLHWPDQHEILEHLPAQRVAGRFGNVIWDLQTSIEELGLKLPEVSEGGGDPPDDSEREGLWRELALQSNQRNVVRGIEEQVFASMPKVGAGFRTGGAVGVMPPYGGKAHVGAVVPGPPGQERTMVVKSGEGIFTPEQMAALGGTGSGPVTVQVHGDIVSSHPDPVQVMIGDKRLQAEIRKVTGQDNRRQARGAGRGLATPGVFSR
ncbi:MAG TPA: hypothetical protein VGV69_02300, partial [Solirubrobacterales bacterium]|nr:hypothetical protein [Solirubrobacterales bacterium]